METTYNNVKEKTYLHYKNNVLYEASEEMLKLTGYVSSDIIGKSFEESSSQFLKGVLSTCVDHHEYEKESVAIYSYPELIHLKVNKNYLNKCKLFSDYDEYSVGKKIYCEEDMLNAIKKNDYYYIEEKEYITKNGDSRYYTIKGNLIYEDGKARYLKVSFIDETERVLTRKALEKREKEMEIILESIPDSIVKINNKGEYTYANKSNIDKFAPHISRSNSLNNEDLYGFFKYSDEYGNELAFEDTPDVRVLRGETVSNYTIIGTSELPTIYYECSGTPIYDEFGNVEGGLLIYRDIEDMYKLNEYNTLSRNLKNLEINYARISFPDFKIQYVNDRCFESIKKIHSNISSTLRVMGKNFFDIYISEALEKQDVIDSIIKSIEENKYPYIYNQRVIEEGKIKYIKSLFQPLFNDKNEIIALNFIGTYITDEELANQEMAKSLREQEEIFVNTSHELKTPINLIFSASQLLNMYLKNDCLDSKRRNIENNNQIIMQNCYRSIKLINNILDVSRIEQGYYQLDLHNKDIVSITGDIVESVAHYIKDKDLKIIFNSEIEEEIIALDLYKFERIMLNLISNAIKFSKDRGVIYIHLDKKDGFIEISVEDQGIGIDAENIKCIFNKFKQENKSLNRKAEGTGIGLSLVESIVKLHGGSISLASVIDVGSTFTFTLPISLVDRQVEAKSEVDENDRVDMIRFELSDIYS